MAVSLKVLALTGALVGGGIAIPVYLKNSGQSVDLKAQAPKQPAPPNSLVKAQPSPKSIEKASCEVSTFPSVDSDMEKFMKTKENQTELYSLVSCNNPTVKGIVDSFFGKHWKGFFPTKALRENLSYKDGSDFGITVTTFQKEAEDSDNQITFTSFSNPSTGASIEGKLEVEDTYFKKKALTIPIKGIKEMPNKVYLFVDAPETETTGQVQ